MQRALQALAVPGMLSTRYTGQNGESPVNGTSTDSVGGSIPLPVTGLAQMVRACLLDQAQNLTTNGKREIAEVRLLKQDFAILTLRRQNLKTPRKERQNPISLQRPGCQWQVGYRLCQICSIVFPKHKAPLRATGNSRRTELHTTQH